jgi:hypothetical protein
MADITYSTDADGQTTFSANTPAGEAFLGVRELEVPNERAQAFLEQARADGLIVILFPSGSAS